MRAHASLVVLASLVACHGGARTSDEASIDAGVVRLYYSPSAAPCPGSAAWLADVAARQAAFLGVPLPARIDYHLVATSDQTPCIGLEPLGGGGCTVDGSAIWATDPGLTHELVHAIAIPQKGYSDSFFEEGLAVALGGDDQPGATDDPPLYPTPSSSLFGQDHLSKTTYPVAGDFVSYLLTKYRVDQLWQLLRSVPKPSTPGQVDAALQSVYGRGFDALVAERMASGLAFANARLSFPECSAAPSSWQNDRWSLATHVACDDASIGMSGGGGSAACRQSESVDVPSDGFYRIDIGATAAGRFGFRHCVAGTRVAAAFTAQPDPVYGLSGEASTLFVPLAAGRHYVSLMADSAAPIDVRVDLAAARAVASDCAMATPVSIDPTRDSVYVVPAADGTPVAVTIQVASERSGVFLAQSDLTFCTNGCDASACAPAMQNEHVDLAPGNTYTLIAKAHAPAFAAGIAFSR